MTQLIKVIDIAFETLNARRPFLWNVDRIKGSDHQLWHDKIYGSRGYTILNTIATLKAKTVDVDYTQSLQKVGTGHKSFQKSVCVFLKTLNKYYT